MTKKRIAFDISSTKSDHRFRGIGTYTIQLLSQLQLLAKKDHELELVTFSRQIPTADLYHFPAFNPFFFSVSFNTINRSIITIHDLIPIEYHQHFPSGLKGTCKWQIQKLMLKRSLSVITDSLSSAASIRKHIGIPKEKTHVIHLGVDDDFIEMVPEAAKKRLKDFQLPDRFVLYVGDINWNKNLMMLAKTCVELHIPLVVVGKQAANSGIDRSHPWNSELVAFQDFAQLHQDYIIRCGFVDRQDLVALYNCATCCVQPSVAEGFGLPVLEAMACGCTVLSSNASSLPEIGGSAVLYFNPFDQQDLREKLMYIFDVKNNQDINTLRQAAKMRAKKFSWQKTAEQTWEIYKKYC